MEETLMILVTGATGNVGSQIVNQLLAQGRTVRVFTRDAAKVAALGNRVELVLGDFAQPETFAKAVVGVEAVFLMNGVLDGALFRQLLAEAKANGSPRVVFLSSLFANDPDLRIGQLHKDKEDALRESGLDYAIVRAGGFMTNAYQWIGSIQSQGVVHNPTGSGPNASVDPEDIAAVAVHALTTPVLKETLFEVTGGTLLTTADRVGVIAKQLGKPLRTVDVPPEKAVEGLKANGIPPQIADALAESYAAIRSGRGAQITDTVQRVTGRPPRTFEAWAQQHASRFA
jgi:uncharacterized protein YbjT (DUF2867 family)